YAGPASVTDAGPAFPARRDRRVPSGGLPGRAGVVDDVVGRHLAQLAGQVGQCARHRQLVPDLGDVDVGGVLARHAVAAQVRPLAGGQLGLGQGPHGTVLALLRHHDVDV